VSGETAERAVCGICPTRTDEPGQKENQKMPKTMVMFLDYTDLPRAWGAANDPKLAEAEARRQLDIYCTKQKMYGEIDLADPARYTMVTRVVEDQ
jgi:hypothetical protein